ncbi:unnamed protein product [Leptosia nina]|uniref:Uncharacterized protein n=1 Tax=Leptosia nina TaxID=320188 RepID=A0AAV1JXS2_9NEOP
MGRMRIYINLIFFIACLTCAIGRPEVQSRVPDSPSRIFGDESDSTTPIEISNFSEHVQIMPQIENDMNPKEEKSETTSDETTTEDATSNYDENFIDDSSVTTLEDGFTESTTENTIITFDYTTDAWRTTEEYNDVILQSVPLPAGALASLLG